MIRANVDVTPEMEQLFREVKKKEVPLMQREAESGTKPFEPLKFQPVRSPKYEAEFALKGDDVIFHFWPPGYHQAEAAGQRTPNFQKGFEGLLRGCLKDTFGTRFDLENDDDLGAFSAKAKGFGLNQFHRELAIKLCEKLHYALGGD